MREDLERARREGCVVCIDRAEVDDNRQLGRVLAVGEEWFLASLIGDHIAHDGFGIMRIDDVTQLDAPHRFADFVEQALHLRSDVPPAAPPIDLSSVESALRSACTCARLVSIHWEAIDPGTCAVGQLAAIDGDSFSFREVSPAARWVRDLAEYDFDELTRIDLLCGYEEALAEVLENGHSAS